MLARGDVMNWRVLLEVTGTDGVAVTHELFTGERNSAEAASGMIGLTLAEGKSSLAVLQHYLVRMQAAAHREARRQCRCGFPPSDQGSALAKVQDVVWRSVR